MRKFNDSIPLKLLQAREVTMGFFRPILQEIPMTEQQWRVIRALNEYDELESKQLADVCCILSPSLTGILSRLEQQGYIQRRKSHEDQRRTLISLTTKARTMFDELSPRLEARYRALTDQLEPHELDTLMTLLDKVCKVKS
jgi:homoprotocatechuate degradation regulator HpaR